MNPECHRETSRQPEQSSSNPLAVSSGVSKYTAIEEANIQFRRGNIAKAREKSELLIDDYLEGNRAVDPELLLAVRLYTRCNRLLGKQVMGFMHHFANGHVVGTYFLRFGVIKFNG